MDNVRINFTRLGNKFFVLSTMANWHFSCQPLYTHQWLRRTGPLRPFERRLLNDLAVILKKYAFGNPRRNWKYLGYYFFLRSDVAAWRGIQRQVTPAEFETLSQVFEKFEPRFEAIWKKAAPRLVIAKKTLGHALKTSTSRNLERDLEMLYQKRYGHLSWHIILVLRPDGLPAIVGGGSANVGPSRLVLEAGDLRPASKRRLTKALMVVFHESVHGRLERPRFVAMLVRFLRSLPPESRRITPLLKTAGSLYTILNEAIVSSLLPHGLLAEKYFGQNTPALFAKTFPQRKPTASQMGNFSAWRIFAAYHLRPILRRYLQQRRPFDEEYTARTYQRYLEYKK